jgi:hypothetical protein
LDVERCVRAVQSKEARFDGSFFTAVLTTWDLLLAGLPGRPAQVGEHALLPERRGGRVGRVPGVRAIARADRLAADRDEHVADERHRLRCRVRQQACLGNAGLARVRVVGRVTIGKIAWSGLIWGVTGMKVPASQETVDPQVLRRRGPGLGPSTRTSNHPAMSPCIASQ